MIFAVRPAVALFLLAASTLLAACSGDEESPSASSGSDPGSSSSTTTGAGGTGGVEGRGGGGATGGDGFTAEMRGGGFRVVTAGEQKYEFQALVGFAATLVPTAEGVDVILNDMPDPTATPFWQELDVLHGEPTNPDEGAGAWRCAPLMIDEPNWHDTKTTVDGT